MRRHKSKERATIEGDLLKKGHAHPVKHMAPIPCKECNGTGRFPLPDGGIEVCYFCDEGVIWK